MFHLVVTIRSNIKGNGKVHISKDVLSGLYYQVILSMSLPLKKPWNNFPTNFLSSLYKFFYCVSHGNILWYFQGTWLTFVMSLLSPPLLRERSVYIGALCLKYF